jgi:hypothetical protein
MNEFKVGDLVMINPTVRRYNHGKIGTIESVKYVPGHLVSNGKPFVACWVIWNDGRRDSYMSICLLHYTKLQRYLSGIDAES